MSDFSPAFLALAADPGTVTPVRLWQALPREDRVRAILTALASDDSQNMRAYFDNLVVSGRGGFRASTVRKWSREELAAKVAGETSPHPGGLL